MTLLELAEIPLSEGSHEIYDFLDTALMLQRSEGRRIAAISDKSRGVQWN